MSRLHPEASPARQAGLRVHTECVVVADPDTAAIKRVRALNHQIGRGLQGDAGVVVGYDQGDHISGRSLNALIPGTPNPANALAAVSRPADAATLRQIGDDYHSVPAINPELDPTAAAWWARLSR